MGDILLASPVIKSLISKGIDYLWVTEELGKGLYPNLNIITYKRLPDLSVNHTEVHDRVFREGFIPTDIILTVPSNNNDFMQLTRGMKGHVFHYTPNEEFELRVSGKHTLEMNCNLLNQFYIKNFIDSTCQNQYLNPLNDKCIDKKKKIAFHIGAQSSFWRHKAFPPKLFYTIMQWTKSLGYTNIVIGDEKQTPYAKMMSQVALDCTGLKMQSTIKELSDCAAFVGNDCGPAHLSAAIGLPTITLWGPTAPARTAPYPLSVPYNRRITSSVQCSPCHFTVNMEKCQTPICHKEITLEDFKNVWLNMMQNQIV